MPRLLYARVGSCYALARKLVGPQTGPYDPRWQESNPHFLCSSRIVVTVYCNGSLLARMYLVGRNVMRKW